jgi:hypothetical protein
VPKKGLKYVAVATGLVGQALQLKAALSALRHNYESAYYAVAAGLFFNDVSRILTSLDRKGKV